MQGVVFRASRKPPDGAMGSQSMVTVLGREIHAGHFEERKK